MLGADPHALRVKLVPPFALGTRGLVVGSILIAAIVAFWALDAPLSGLIAHESGFEVVKRFFGAALHPALAYEDAPPAGTPHILEQALHGARRTLVFAAAAMSLALVFGLVLGFLASGTWWRGDASGGSSSFERLLRTAIGPAVWSVARIVIVAMRSVHELLWAVLFLAAFGLNTFGAVAAIAIPYTGTLAKIFSEMIDEAPRDSAHALRAIGGGPVQVFALGLVPRALPDMCAYAFYRFECAVRSSAVLGFFGFPTLGYFIAQSFENLHYREVWTYLYALMLLVIGIELWSGALRRRFVA